MYTGVPPSVPKVVALKRRHRRILTKFGQAQSNYTSEPFGRPVQGQQSPQSLFSELQHRVAVGSRREGP